MGQDFIIYCLFFLLLTTDARNTRVYAYRDFLSCLSFVL